MRPVPVVALLVALGAAGCLGPHVATLAAVSPDHAFIAGYDVLWTKGTLPPLDRPLPEGAANGHLALRLDGTTVRRADQDLEPRDANVLAIDLTSTMDPATDHDWVQWHSADAVVDSAVMRTDHDCEVIQSALLGFRATCGELPHEHPFLESNWAVRGMPLPLGIGWRDRPVGVPSPEGRLLQVQLVQGQDGSWALPAGTVLPYDALDDPGARYVYDKGILPLRMQFTLGGTYHLRADLTQAADLGALVPLPPLTPASRDALRPRPTLPGLADEAFGTGLTFGDGFGRLAQAGAQPILDGGCLLEGGVFWGGGDRRGLPRSMLDRDVISFFLYGTHSNDTDTPDSWSISHDAHGLLGQWGTPQHVSEPPLPLVRCIGNAFPDEAPTDFVKAAWRVPTPASGAPCDLGLQARRWRTAGGSLLGPIDFVTHPDPGATDNDPGDGNMTGPPVVMEYSTVRGGADQGTSMTGDGASGHWLALRLVPSDMAALDAGAVHRPRALPPPQPLAAPGPLDTTYRCIPPSRDS